jgi:hypothetical protein
MEGSKLNRQTVVLRYKTRGTKDCRDPRGRPFIILVVPVALMTLVLEKPLAKMTFDVCRLSADKTYFQLSIFNYQLNFTIFVI